MRKLDAKSKWKEILMPYYFVCHIQLVEYAKQYAGKVDTLGIKYQQTTKLVE